MTSRVIACPQQQAASNFVPPIPFSVGGLLPCNLDTGKPGRYNVTFSVTNDAGLTASADRTVIVIPVCQPGERVCSDLLTCSTDRLCDLIEVSTHYTCSCMHEP